MAIFQSLIALGDLSASSSLIVGTEVFKVRPFSSPQDKENLADICKDVWGGTDYLPNLAHSFEEDPSCDFVILEHEKTGEMVAAGNRRFMDEAGESVWIEAIRVSTRFKRRGIATLFMQELCRMSKEGGALEILSCTVDTNDAMKNVFGKAGIEMKPISSAYFPDLQKLKELPGWSPSAGTDSEVQPENLLKALDLEHLVKDASRSETWEAIESEEELKSLLEILRNFGRTGHLPGYGKLLEMSDDLKESIEKGLVRKLCKTDGGPPAVMAFAKDKVIQSRIRSQYVCSIVATTSHDFDSAVWEACKSEYVPLLGGNPTFCCMFELPIPSSPGSLIESFPKQSKNDFVFYGWADNN